MPDQAMIAEPDTGPADGAPGQLSCLDTLADKLTRRGLQAWITAPPDRVPSLHVANPATTAHEENVYAERGQDGTWWFWWPWAERISRATDLDRAASTIARVVAPRTGTQS